MKCTRLNDAWDRELGTFLVDAKISDASKHFIYRTNKTMGIGRWGYIGQVIYAMNGSSPDAAAGYGMWLDSCIHIFGTKLVDDFFDLNGHSVPTLLKRSEALDWENIKRRCRQNRNMTKEKNIFQEESLILTGQSEKLQL